MVLDESFAVLPRKLPLNYLDRVVKESWSLQSERANAYTVDDVGTGRCASSARMVEVVPSWWKLGAFLRNTLE